MTTENPKVWTIIGPLGDTPIQAPTPGQAAALYPTVKGWKQVNPAAHVVTVKETGQRYEVVPVVAYEAKLLP